MIIHEYSNHFSMEIPMVNTNQKDTSDAHPNNISFPLTQSITKHVWELCDDTLRFVRHLEKILWEWWAPPFRILDSEDTHDHFISWNLSNSSVYLIREKFVRMVILTQHSAIGIIHRWSRRCWSNRSARLGARLTIEWHRWKNIFVHRVFRRICWIILERGIGNTQLFNRCNGWSCHCYDKVVKNGNEVDYPKKKRTTLLIGRQKGKNVGREEKNFFSCCQ